MEPTTAENTQQWEIPNGLQIDREEAWCKLISHQFGGTPGRGFAELIQNAIDSYPSITPMEERKGEIRSIGRNLSITDYGEGLSRQRIKLLCTLGGTDKRDDSSKIGMFGMGFFAIFNPKLGTERVVVTTCCEGSSVEVSFHVETPGKCPKISLRVLDEPLPFSTRIEVQFNRITLLCKYERLTELEIASLGKGGHGMYQTYISVLKDLRHSSQSFQRPECPSL